MECVQCGATLRPNARFCNRCGAQQPQPERHDEALAPVGVELAPAGSHALGEAADAGEAGSSSGRLKRAPRPLRADHEDADHEDADEPQNADAPATDQPADAAPAQAAPLQDAPEDAPEAAEPQAAPTLPVSAVTDETAMIAQEPTAAVDARAETAAPEDSVTAPEDSVADSVAAPAPAAPVAADARDADRAGRAPEGQFPEGRFFVGDEGDADPDAPTLAQERIAPTPEAPAALVVKDALSWPLPVSMIVGGRYRVEAILTAAPDELDAENVYQVSDLQGYERCWSCHTAYGAAAASDRFCRECGADMLAREFLLFEKRLSTAPISDDVADAPTMEMPIQRRDPSDDEERGAQDDDGEERAFMQGARVYHVVSKYVEPPLFPFGARLLAAAASNVGKTRPGERNEDSVGVLTLDLTHDSHTQPLALAIVADGLGGHANGQDASRLVLRAVTEHITRHVALPLIGLPVDARATEDGLENVLREAARTANLALCKANSETDADMGSTMVAALIFGETAYIANAGDSRAYVLDDEGLRRITRDHSLVEQLVAGGMIAPEDRYSHPQRNQIYRSLGDDPELKVDIFTQRLRPGMRFLLCSDGVWEMVRDDELAEALRAAPSPQAACDDLVRRANANGGEDNISAAVVEVGG